MKHYGKFIQFSFLLLFICIIPFYNVQSSSDASPKRVYITFDDGPTKITNRLLEVLKKEDVKATFFVVGKEIAGREDILRRIYDDGHAIGLHTYSHNYTTVYSNENNFIDEMKRTSERVKEITGCSPSAIRFPGGSSKRLNQSFLDKLHENNFRVYDWNSDLYDGEYPNLSVYRLLENAKRFKGSSSSIIILMHCNSNNENTVKALPKIIEYYRNQGFQLLPISSDTEEYYYRF